MYYKYLPKDRTDVIKNLKIRFTQPGALNDPFESTPLIKDFDDPYLHLRASDQAAKSGADEILARSFTVGVLSLSRTKENLLLWSHYAGSHTGYAIEFDENNVFFKTNPEKGMYKPILVSYTSQRPIIKRSDINELENIFDFHFEDLIKILGQKSIDWAYEEEVRVFRDISNLLSLESYNGYELKLAEIPPDAIIGIYLGANMEESVQREIISACQQNGLNVPIYKALLSNDSYSLDFSILPAV
jgi:hypothetical protein